MDEPVHVMTREQAEVYKARFKRATEKWSGQTFKHFADVGAGKRHLAEVKEAQEAGAPF